MAQQSSSADSIEESGKNESELLTNRIFIGNLASELEEFTIYKYCSAYGEITRCQIMKEAKTGRNRGFGFITYAQASSAQAILNARPHYIGHHKINVKSAFPTGEALIQKYTTEQSSELPRTRRIFIAYNMDEANRKNLAEPAIFGFLSTYGVVKEIVQQFSSNFSSGNKQTPANNYWIVEFMDEDSVDRCISQGSIQYFSGIRLHLKRVINEQDILRKKRKVQEENRQKELQRTMATQSRSQDYFPSTRSMFMSYHQPPVPSHSFPPLAAYNNNFSSHQSRQIPPLSKAALAANQSNNSLHNQVGNKQTANLRVSLLTEAKLDSSKLPGEDILAGYGYQQQQGTETNRSGPSIKRFREDSWR